jgi:hypothetical protein
MGGSNDHHDPHIMPVMGGLFWLGYTRLTVGGRLEEKCRMKGLVALVAEDSDIGQTPGFRR